MKKYKMKKVFEGYFNVIQIDIHDKKTASARVIINPKNAVAAIVYDTKKDLYIFVEQWRPGVLGDITEVVAGTLESGESTVEAIKREVFEETGYITDSLKEISKFFVSPGISSEQITLFYIEVSSKAGAGGGIALEGEDISLVSYTYDKLLKQIFLDAKTIIGINYLKKLKEAG